jgi:hypothetical protein
MTTPQPGELWLDPRPSTDTAWRDQSDRRRVVRVTAVDASYVTGKSAWQALGRDGWVDYLSPRTTRILAAEFLRRFTRIED